MTADFIPRLRQDIEVIPTVYQGSAAYVIKDGLGLIPEPVIVQGSGLELMRFMDGKRNIQDIQLEFMRAHNNVYFSQEEITKYVSALDAAMILDSPRYQESKARIVAEYNQLDIREAHLAGKAYPTESKELNSLLASILQQAEPLPDTIIPDSIKALVAPHIDIELGRKVYANAYSAISRLTPRRIVVLGTGHNLRDGFFALTSKDFLTPLGRVSTHKEWIQSLYTAGGDAVCADDMAHRSEHSLEFQLLFLQHLFGSDFSLVPVLCGSFHQILMALHRPSENPGIKDFLQQLRNCVADDPSTLIVAGVDFSHVGPKFGHSQYASVLLPETRQHDNRLMQAICQGDLTGFWGEVQQVEDKYNVCGLSAIACLMELCPDMIGHVLGYDVWEEQPTRSAVSFGAISLGLA